MLFDFGFWSACYKGCIDDCREAIARKHVRDILEPSMQVGNRWQWYCVFGYHISDSVDKGGKPAIALNRV